mmetsp:Transcript_48060/g.134260  ORF Transcript_48060/g.134260 Transcript_48060/m.134260 type:complete len:333 (+) Transcript_48060:1169-2167(+)
MGPETGRIFWVGMEYRYMPPIARLLEHVDNGEIGKLHMVHIREHRFPFLLKVGNWNRFSENTGGTLVEKCCHFWDLMRRILQGAKAVRVYATGGMDVNHIGETYEVNGVKKRPDIIDNAFVSIDFDNGARGCLDLCMFAEDRQHEEVHVVGSKGKVHAEAPACVVTMHMPQPASSRVPPAKGQYEQHTTSENTEVPQALLEVRKQRVRENSKSKPPSPSLSPTDFHHPQAGHHEGATFYELEAFVNAVQSGGSAVVTIEDGIEAVAMGVAAELSIKEKRVVDMQEVMALIDGTGPASAGAAGSGPASASATGSEAAEEHAAKRHKGPVPSKL